MTDEPLTILAVEDEALIAMELEDLLKDLGHNVMGPASTPAAAIELLQSRKPDVAVVDANLAGKSAQPVVDALKDAGVPVILASGYEPNELKQFGLEGLLVSKPYRAKDLARALEHVLRSGKD
ncbi:response regulator [Silicimonas algicola]|uniref:CheY-like chemotaxis protein n=1 Tax=Silicimonas algicola TaxID=1826607 RepID=A0A316G5H5_9RHOB|nr:response regulator [Silicimonas algicola]AZQ66890.1 response regulator [Silicimonas algicola]PWK55196.1 CheY-like chemotaxis protein [Silicimonas algicola]